MRPMIPGRKNWLFRGSDAGGIRAAMTYTLTEMAKPNGLHPENYPRGVLTCIADHPIKRVNERQPSNTSAIRHRQDEREAA
jgi:transposase